jgi:hypothetical protein
MDAVRSILAAVALLAFAALATRMAFGFGVEARRLPITVGLPLTAMSAINLVLVVRTELIALGRIPARLALAPDTTTQPEGGDVASGSPEVEHIQALRDAANESGLEEATAEGLSFTGALLAVAVVAGLFFMLGLVPAAIIYTIGFMKGVGKESWTKALVVTSLLVLMFWTFRTFLNVRFYRGWLVTEGFVPYVLPF